MSAVILFIEARHEILRCNIKIKVAAETFAKLSKDCGAAIVSTVMKYTISEVDIARAMASVSEGPMLDDDKSLVVSSLTARLATDPSQGASLQRRSLQNAELIRNYFTEDEWLNNLAPGVPRDQKIDFVCKRAILLGIVSPTEKSVAAMTAIVMFGMDASPSQVLVVLRDVKKQMKSIVSRIVPTVMPPVLPESPADFAKEFGTLYGGVFGAAEPCKPPGNNMTWSQWQACVPCRITRAGCQDVAQVGVKTGRAMQALSDVMKQQQRGNVFQNDIPLTYFSTDGQYSFQRQGLALHSGVPQQQQQQQQQLALQFLPSLQGAQPAPQAAQPAMLALPPWQPPDQESQASSSPPEQPKTAVAAPIDVANSVDAMVAAMKAQISKAPASKDAKQTAKKRPAAAPEVASAAEPVKTAKKRRAAAPASATVPMKTKAPAVNYVAVKKLKLGCAKCRYLKNGCKQCRNPAFAGKRGHC